MRSKKIIVAVFMLLFGLMLLIKILTSTRLRAIRGPDLLQLVAFGLCVGAGAALLLEKYLPDGEW